MLRCEDCDVSLAPGQLYCEECGSDGTHVTVEASEASEASQGGARAERSLGPSPRHLMDVFHGAGGGLPPAFLNDTMFNSFGDDLRAAIEASMLDQSPSREIGSSFLRTLGRISLDATQSLLHSITLKVGPLQCNLTFAEFSPCIGGELVRINDANVVLAMPACGDAASLSNPEVRESILVIKRGKVSFAAKALLAQRSGAVALIVTQTYDVWPFVPKDSVGEIAENQLTIPILSMSKRDAELLTRVIQETDKTPPGSSALKGCLEGIARTSDLCSICYEDMAAGDEVYKLPCCHTFHVECLSSWIASHNTCPLCRLAMPTKSEETVNENSRRSAASSEMMY